VTEHDTVERLLRTMRDLVTRTREYRETDELARLADEWSLTFVLFDQALRNQREVRMDVHIPAQIGRYDRDSYRTYQTPGDVCIGCSSPDAGIWVPVNECVIAWERFTEETEWIESNGPRPTWLPEVSE